MKMHPHRGRATLILIAVMGWLCSVAGAVTYDDFPPELQLILDERIAELNAKGGICSAGRVVFGDGVPISSAEDAQVNLHHGIDAPHRMYADGWFIMHRTYSSFYAGENRGFVVRAFGYDPIDAELTVLDGQITYLDFVLSPTPIDLLASVEGIVTDENDLPFPGAPVVINFPFSNFGGSSTNGYSYPRMETVSASNGEYAFQGLSTTAHWLISSAPDYAFHLAVFTPPPGGIAIENRRLYPKRRITLTYVHQTDGSRSFAGGALQTGTINWLVGSGGVDFSEGVVEGYEQNDLRDLEMRQDQDVLMFRIFYSTGHNGFYDAGAIDFDGLLEAAESGYSVSPRPCLVGHVYVVRTYEEDQYVKLLVMTDESSFRTVTAGNPAPIVFAGYGLTVDFSFVSGASQLFVEKHFAPPPVVGDDALPFYLELTGMAGATFLADLTLTYDESDVIDRRLVEENLTLLRSLDGGFTWFELETTLDTQADTLTTEGLATFGWLAIADLSERQPGDMDRDADIDLEDMRLFQICYTGSAAAQADPACVAGMLDADGDIDLADFGLFSGCMAGPDALADPVCAD